MKDLDCFLLTPAQREELLEQGKRQLSIPKALGVLALAFLGEIVLTFLSFFVIAFLFALSGADPLQDFPAWLNISLSLFCTAGAVIVILLFHRRDTDLVGCKSPFPMEYLAGLLAGFAVFSGAVVICVLSGTLELTGLSPTFALGPWLVIFVGFLIQGLSEELLCRGLLMLTFSRWGLMKGRKNSATLAVILSALVFAALHLANNGIAPLALVNLFLFGLFAGFYYLWRGNIWGIAAFHSMWNFTQGNVFGILVSGNDFGSSLLASASDPAGELVNGGPFGLEGGLAVTVVLTLGVVFVLWRNSVRVAKSAPSAASEIF